MSTQTRIAAFVLGLAVVFGIAFGAARLIDDDGAESTAYSVDLYVDGASASTPVPIRFSVRDAERRTVTGFAIRHEKLLHLIAVRTDFGGYRHLHPTMAADGVWSIDAELAAGNWRLYADFQPDGGEPEVATADLAVGGAPSTMPPSAVNRMAMMDGYTVEVFGDLMARSAAELRFRVSRDGVPVTDLQPYLGAYGHLVVLRDSDLGYLHAHPGDGPAGPDIPFHIEGQTAGRYHLFLDFKHGDIVRTARFVLDAGALASTGATQDGGSHGH